MVASKDSIAIGYIKFGQNLIYWNIGYGFKEEKCNNHPAEDCLWLYIFIVSGFFLSKQGHHYHCIFKLIRVTDVSETPFKPASMI